MGGRSLSPELLQELEQVGASCSRRQLARHLCGLWQWRGPSGRLQEMSARKLLAQLARTGHLRLPVAREGPQRRAAGPEPGIEPLPAVEGSLAEVGLIEVELVGSRYRPASRQWRHLVDRYHYLGAGPLCGDQLRYLVRCGQGVVGALSFSAAARAVAARDQWIGWDRAARRENLYHVVNNSRFLILPQVRVPHLASHVLGQVLRRLPEDWQGRYGYRPVLVETFVEQGRFRGVSYQAANWQAIGLTTGRGRQDTDHVPPGSRKILWVYPLQKNFRSVLQRLPARPRLPGLPGLPGPPPPSAPADWAEEEFAQAPLGDRRLSRRLCMLARDLYARPQAQLPQACGSRAKAKAAYRLLSHPRLTMSNGLQGHYEATTRRVGTESVVLAVQDTTSLNYSAHPATELLGLIGTEPQGPIGMFVHSTLAFNEAGTPLGLLDVQSWVRDPEDWGKKHRRYELPLEAKESVRWLRSLEAVARVQARCPQTRLVSVGDREADIYELFVWVQAHPEGPALLVRAERERVLSEDQGGLWEKVAGAPVAGRLELKVPRRGSRPGRQAVLEVRSAEVQLRAPKRKRGLPAVRLWAVLAREVQAPVGTEPVEWMLLSTLPVESFESAVEKLRWYAGRWGIEVFHRVLKSGCQIETRQLAGADRIEACLAIDLVVAWRIYHLTKLGRETPEVPCTVYFEEHEWKALVAYVTQNPQPPAQPPTLREAVRMVASLGGFLGRKSDGEPGTQTTWLGLQRLDDLSAMYRVMTTCSRRPPTVSSSREYG
jgi:Druantia protein DruA/Transposase Tn5 dimerisation domain/Transposase DNA-binding